MTLSEIDLTLNQPLSILLKEIGKDSSAGMAISPVDPEDAGETWFAKSKSKLRETICQSQSVTTYLECPKRWDEAVLVAAIADLISSLCVGVSPVTVAALVLKKGLHTLCSNE